MLAKINSITFYGVKVIPITVQVHISNGIPSINIVGLANKSITESKDRIKAAFFSLGLTLPNKKIVVNLSPANILKDGNHFDLPIACGILVAMGLLKQEDFVNNILIGELSLDGAILPVPGVLPAACLANEKNLALICSYFNRAEASWISNLDILALKNLIDLINYIKGISTPEYFSETKSNDDFIESLPNNIPDMSLIIGQLSAKRATEIAAAGGHNILFTGSPGSGKSMLARSLLSILPDLTAQEILDINMIRSIFGFLQEGKIYKNRPFRTPHHTSSSVALIGGSSKTALGEISLAHRGLLFLDELPEFRRDAIEALREPLESKIISISRAKYKITYPANFQLVAAMNPCKCGDFMNVKKRCSKAPQCAKSYQNHISGPILDRIHLHVGVSNVKLNEVRNSQNNDLESSSVIKERVIKARAYQQDRYKSTDILNNDIDGNNFEKLINISNEALNITYSAFEALNLSMRSYKNLLRIARTIADLDNLEQVNTDAIEEALSYRNKFT